MKSYYDHPFFYGDKCYAKVNGKMIEISREVALAMHNFYRSAMDKTIEVKDENGEVVGKVRREVPYSCAKEVDTDFSMETLPDPSFNLEETVMKNVEHQKLHRMIGQLSAEEKFLIHSIYFEDKTQTEVAAILGVSQQAVAYRLKVTLAKMKKMFFGKN